jgi:hypothetical protein
MDAAYNTYTPCPAEVYRDAIYMFKRFLAREVNQPLDHVRVNDCEWLVLYLLAKHIHRVAPIPSLYTNDNLTFQYMCRLQLGLRPSTRSLIIDICVDVLSAGGGSNSRVDLEDRHAHRCSGATL